MKWFKSLSVAAMALAIVTTGVSSANAASSLSGSIVINGSSALLPLTLQAKSEFQKLNPKVKISASSAGSVTGPQAVRKGIAQIGACDWDATKDVPGFKAFEGQIATPVAVIPFAAIVNSDVKVNNLTTQQLKDIFSGKIKNWKDVGGDDADIVIVNRAFGSGTRVNFQLKALEGGSIVSTGSNVKTVKSSGEMKTNVETTSGAIGYEALAYVAGSKMKALSINGVAPTEANIINGKYKVWSYGYYMTKGQPTGVTKAFIDYIRSAKFQNGSLKKLKFIPLSAIK
ncbi:phosphate ABC transporter substrate-binding protein [Cohnella pontilimi]|uniref:Phosphate-binding protein n=1 Tax=Cohnella pontilimi TaxID=2564100 RepID=A0A4U0F5L7_9BACL|nr:phosphate ABC transporter substrate-binding protein [Cohnella pontilimi]TJY39710.1 phosphate ABC transporter substrate-binding protein [Cohnella pontilimi]